jgi:hypothetical protein
MANRERGEVALEVGGQQYTLVLTTNAMCELEDLLSTPDKDVTFPEVVTKAARLSIRAMRALVWAAARERHPEMTLAQAGALIYAAGGVIGFKPTMDKIIDSAQPDKADVETSEVEGKRPPKAQATRGTGGNSTSKPVVAA